MNPKLLARLCSFRGELYGTLGLRQDSLFELMDAVLTAPERRTLVRLSLCPCFRRRWSSTCDALADGSLDVSRLRALFQTYVPLAAPAKRPRCPDRWSRWTVLTRWANSLRLTWKQTWWCAWPRTASSAARRSRTLAVVDCTHMARSSSSRTPAPMAQPTAWPAWSTRCTGP